MTRHQNQPNRTLLRTGLPVFCLIILVCFLPSLAWACDCMIPGAPGGEWEESDLVMMGKVVRIEGRDDLSMARFTVEKVWKGF